MKTKYEYLIPQKTAMKQIPPFKYMVMFFHT